MTTRVAAEIMPVAVGDERVSYGGFAMMLHWLTAVLVVLLFVLAVSWRFAAKATREEMIVAHLSSFGILLTMVLVIRIAWRLMPGHRVQDATTGLVELASKVVHYLLYVLLVAQAVLELRLALFSSEAMRFFGLLIRPPFAPFAKSAHTLVGDAHNWIG